MIIVSTRSLSEINELDHFMGLNKRDIIKRA